MDGALKPERFSTLPNASTASLEWKHWFRTFENFLHSLPSNKSSKANPLMCLTNNVSSNIFNYFADCLTYEDAIRVLRGLYEKKKNPILARYSLLSRKQASNESIDEYLSTLQLLARECEYTAVSAEEHRQKSVRDAFVFGLNSVQIRQRLLETSDVSLHETISLARTIETAQRDASAYSNQSSSTVVSAAINESVQEPQDLNLVAAVKKNSSCFFCGYQAHDRRMCPAKDAICKKCSKKGHFAKVCRSRIHNQPMSASALSEPKEIICLSLTAKTQKLLPQSFVDIHINSKCFKALIDSGSSSCFINDKIAQLLHLKVHKTLQNVTMASTSESILSPGYCIVDISLLSRSYPNLQLTVMPNLCTDVILGYDFMSLHRSISFSYNNGSIEALSICSAIPMSIDPPCLFPKFTLDCRPVSCPSRHFNSDDRQFIQQEISQLLEEGTIEPSNSAWRAQVVITKNSNHRKRLVIDYSQTVNRFTQRDAYPLPLIEDLVHQVSQNNVFSTLDLKSAYHQIPLKHDEKPYTAFEANGRLYQFTRIPFGLTNAVSAFQRIMNDIITANQLKGVYSYLDDIIVAGKTLEEHDKNMARFLEISRSLNMTLNEAKCSWRLETINFLGYTICHGEVKPDSNRLEPLRNLPLPMDQSALKRVIGLFSYYSKWIQKFSEKIIPLTSSSFPLNESARKSFYDIKSDIEKAALSYIDEGLPFVVETDASDNAIAATLNQNGQPVAFFSRKLSEAEKKFPSIEKEAYAIVEALRKWRHFLLIRPFSLLTDQEGVSFMFNRNNCGKIKNSKIQRWRMELSCFEFDIQYRPGKDNAPADALSRICGAVPKKLSLELIHKHLCHPGISRLYHYVRHKNLSYSVDDIRKVCRECPSCSELKPRFLKTSSTNLIKATRSFERISIDFMGPKASSTNNRYLLTVVDEYSRFPFAFPCPDMNADTVIRCLQSLFTLCGTPEAIHSDRGSQFMSDSFQQFLRDKNIAQTRTSPYNPAGNGQCERFNQTIWKAVQLTVHSRCLKDTQWESVLPDVLHSIRSLLCTSTNTTPHERFFNFNRKSTIGASVPSWLLEAKSVLIKRHVRPNKNDPLVDRAEVIQVNPNYAVVRLKSGRETSVSLRDIAPCCDAEENKLLSNQQLDGEDLQIEEDRTQELKVGENRNSWT